MTQLDLLELAGRIRSAAAEQGTTVSTAESCTGGLIGHLLTEIAGSSAYYLGGAVTYSDELKRAVLGVDPATLASHGAVSAQVAVAMAEGARRSFASGLAVAVTGIAGPDGGTPSKPVGLTYVAVADAAGHEVRRFTWHGDRTRNKEESARAALELLLDRLLGGLPR